MLKRIVLLLFAGSALNSGLSLFFIVILTKTYGLASFGYYATILSYISILSVLVTLKQEHLINSTFSLTKSKYYSDVTLQLQVVIGVSILIFSICYYYLSSKSEFLLIALASILNGQHDILRMYLIKCGKAKKINYLLITRSVLIFCFQLMFYKLQLDYGLIYGYVIGSAFSFFLVPKILFRYLGNFFKIKIKSIFRLVKKNYSLSIIAVTNSISNELLIIIGALYFSVETIGIIFVIQRFTKAPVSLLIRSVTDGLRWYLSNSDLQLINKKIGSYTNAIIKYLPITIIIYAFLLYIIKDYLINTFKIASLLLIISLVQLLIAPLFSYFIRAKAIYKYLYLSVLRVCLISLSLFIPAHLGYTFNSYVIFYTITILLYYYFVSVFIKNIISKQ